MGCGMSKPYHHEMHRQSRRHGKATRRETSSERSSTSTSRGSPRPSTSHRTVHASILSCAADPLSLDAEIRHTVKRDGEGRARSNLEWVRRQPAPPLRATVRDRRGASNDTRRRYERRGAVAGREEVGNYSRQQRGHGAHDYGQSSRRHGGYGPENSQEDVEGHPDGEDGGVQ